MTLNDGGTASYDAAHSTATSLVFDYTVASGQTNVASLAVTSVSLNGATITDGAGNVANLSRRRRHLQRPADRHHHAERDGGNGLAVDRR